MKHYPFPSIKQFREIVYEIKNKATFVELDPTGEPVFDETKEKPTLLFEGTFKLHGTNSSIVWVKETDSIQFQSKESILHPDLDTKDNSAFRFNLEPKSEQLKEWIKICLQNSNIECKEYAAVYGEWCGKGIQKGDAITKLDRKIFVAFTYFKVDDVWYRFPYFNNALDIHNVKKGGEISIEIDFNHPEEALEELNSLIPKIEEQCPFAKTLGVEGHGEGIVFIGKWNDTFYRFKIKSEKHKLKASEKKRPLINLDVDMYNSVKEFVADNLSQNRLEQGLTYLTENGMDIQMKFIGQYLQWCSKDIFKECDIEIKANNLDEKMISREAQQVARKFFVDYLNSHL